MLREACGGLGAGRLQAVEMFGDVGDGSAGLTSSSVGKRDSRRYDGESWGAGDTGQPRALSSEGTGLGQRPSPGKYRMHFFFLLGIVKRVICKQRVNSQSYTTTKKCCPRAGPASSFPHDLGDMPKSSVELLDLAQTWDRCSSHNSHKVAQGPFVARPEPLGSLSWSGPLGFCCLCECVAQMHTKGRGCFNE